VAQPSWQVVLTLALLVVVAAPVGGVPGKMQAVWQVAAWELHVIMQLVTVDVCASRILPLSAAAMVGPPINKAVQTIASRRMTASPVRTEAVS
jgi:hypothetical protein